MKHLQYRRDIDGLRAVAVLAVVLFHLFPGRFYSGFIGVDIFFVISGFLISGILFKNLETNSFSYADFYARRIRRIFPALLLVLFTTLLVGWYVLFPFEYVQLGKHIAGGAGFVSNFILWQESGYFDSDAVTKPLHHLWSLGVEEQFYIFWPILLGLVYRRKWNFLWVTLAIGALSFGLNIFTVADYPTAAFYSPLSRFFELMIGGVLAYVMQHRSEWLSRYKNAQSVLGFLLLGLGFLFISEARLFPGWWALLPCFGAFLIIAAGQEAWLNKYLLGNKVAVGIGLISYPLYLWHWPILSFVSIREVSFPCPVARICIFFVSLAFSWVTYIIIEKRIRKSSNPVPGLILPMASLVFIVFIDFSKYQDVRAEQFAEYFENSLPSWSYINREGIHAKYRDECNFRDLENYRLGGDSKVPRRDISEDCYKPKNYGKTLFIWGDSHAQQLYYGLSRGLPKDWEVLQVASSGCKASLNVSEDSNFDYCKKSNYFAVKTIREVKPDVVIVGQDRGHDVDNMNRVSNSLRALGVRKIIFTGPVPHWKADLPKIILRKLWNNSANRDIEYINKKVLTDDKYLKEHFHRAPDSRYISLTDYFCNTEGCLLSIGPDRMRGLVTWDYGHLTPVASEILARDVLVPVILD